MLWTSPDFFPLIINKINAFELKIASLNFQIFEGPFSFNNSIMYLNLHSPDCCEKVTMTAFGKEHQLGVPAGIFGGYVKTGETSEGAPVYKCDSNEKYYLYKLNDGCWHSGFDSLGRGGSIRCCSDAPCPESASDWQYDDHGDWRSGDMAAQCLSGGGGGGGFVSSTQPTFHVPEPEPEPEPWTLDPWTPGHGGGGGSEYRRSSSSKESIIEIVALHRNIT